MNSSDLQRIEHIEQYCKDVAKTIQRFGESYAVFQNDVDYLNSISMSIMQIGELSVGLSDDFKQATGKQMQWGAIRGMRNMYAHAYAKMDKMSIWETATIDIPGLRAFCKATIKKADENQSSSLDQAEVSQQADQDEYDLEI